jgi:hypothetical protein
MKPNPSRLLAAAFIPLLFVASTAHAQEAGATTSWHPTGLLHSVIASVIFGFIGIVLAIVGFKMFDWAIPFNLEKEICQEKNIAVGILCAAIVLGICHIIAASMS